MDFSSSPRALQSLLRRKPSIDDPEIISLTKNLQEIVEKKVSGDSTYPSKILHLISYGISHRWEALAVGVHLTIEYLIQIVKDQSDGANSSEIYPEGPRVPEMVASDQQTQTTFEELDMNALSSFCQHLSDTCIHQLEHPEPRVRTLIAKAIGAHGKICFLFSKDHSDFTTQRHEIYKRVTSSLFALLRSGRDKDSLMIASDGSKLALDDTTGWKSLETSLHALAAFLDAPPTFSDIDQEQSEQLLELIQALNHCATVHVNRHVRAASLQALERYITKGCVPNQLLETNLRKQFAEILSITLADNWSQVRMAACTLCRTLFVTLQSADLPINSYFPKLLPRMCLNRFYLAQGVKLYSQETWRIIMGKSGILSVIQNIGGIVRYYISCCDADNHVVREAACQAVAELAQKVGANEEYTPYLEPFVSTLLQALLMCFHDESWPVRDQACTACGTFAKSYPEICRLELPILWERWSSQLTDQIWSVREGAAIALGDAMCAFGEEFQEKVIQYVKDLMPGAKEEKAMSQEEYDKRQNDYELHSNSQLYSCGSLAPKLRKGGCSDCIVTRPKAAWERTDGCIYMLREICVKIGSGELSVPDEILLPLMNELAEVSRVNHFPLAEDLRCTLWKCLPEMGKGLGKKRFKSKYLNQFLDLLVRNLERGSANSQHAASMCVRVLYNLVGEGIVKGRVKDVVGDHALRILDTYVGFAGCRDPMVESMVSPFGPPIVRNNMSGSGTSSSVWGSEEAF